MSIGLNITDLSSRSREARTSSVADVQISTSFCRRSPSVIIPGGIDFLPALLRPHNVREFLLCLGRANIIDRDR